MDKKLLQIREIFFSILLKIIIIIIIIIIILLNYPANKLVSKIKLSGYIGIYVPSASKLPNY